MSTIEVKDVNRGLEWRGWFSSSLELGRANQAPLDTVVGNVWWGNVYSWMLWSHSKGLYSNRLSQIFSFYLILSDCFRLQTVRRFPTGTHLSHNLHISQTHVCLMANLILLNLTLFLIVHFCAMHGYAATHMHFPHVMLLFHSATAIWLHHVSNPCYVCPR